MTERRRKPGEERRSDPSGRSALTTRQRVEPYAVVTAVVLFWAVVAFAVWKVAS